MAESETGWFLNPSAETSEGDHQVDRIVLRELPRSRVQASGYNAP
jgi:hypothetical protein